MKHDSTLKGRFLALNGALTSNRCFIAREFEESLNVGKQMMGEQPVRLQVTHKSYVKRLQMRIAKIVKLGIITLDSRVAQQGQLLKCLSRSAGKLARSVLRGRSGRKAGELPGHTKI